MKLIPINTSLVSFQIPNATLLYLDPYNNTLGEKNQFIVFYVIIFCIICICAIYLMFGIIMFEKYGLNPDNRRLLDMLISFAMILNIIDSGPNIILLVHRNVIGPLQDQDIVVGLLSIRTFTQISTFINVLWSPNRWWISLLFIGKIIQGRSEVAERPWKVIQGRSATSERPCMTFHVRSATSEWGCMIFKKKFVKKRQDILYKNVLKRFCSQNCIYI